MLMHTYALGSRNAHHRGRDAGCPTPPAQIPACSFSAPGSSERLASAKDVAVFVAIPLSEVGLGAPTRQAGPGFLCGLRLSVRPFPVRTALPFSEYYERI